jgi:hypothetical protein
MPHSFPLRLDSAQIVGRTPWSARVPLDPLFVRRIKVLGACDQADEGVRWWENYVALGRIARPTKTQKIRYQAPRQPRIQAALLERSRQNRLHWQAGALSSMRGYNGLRQETRFPGCGFAHDFAAICLVCDIANV